MEKKIFLMTRNFDQIPNRDNFWLIIFPENKGPRMYDSEKILSKLVETA